MVDPLSIRDDGQLHFQQCLILLNSNAHGMSRFTKVLDASFSRVN